MIRSVLPYLRYLRAKSRLPRRAKAEAHRDLRVGLAADPGILPAVHASLNWLCEAQDRSKSADGGVARDFSLVESWATSYPETTGYIIPTVIDAAGRFNRPDLLERARRMTDWLVDIQLADGGFQGGMMGDQPVVPVTFNTGQILMGLSAAVIAFGEAYRRPTERAADWLVQTQDGDGCWRRNPSPFAAPGEKAYETHVSWGLLEAERVAPGRGYAEAALKNVRWAITQQRSNGWFDACCLMRPDSPLTHTIGYVLRGVLEAHRFSGDPFFLESAKRTADGILTAIEPDGRLPGQLDENWRGTVDSVCLTGSVQIASCWFMLYSITGDRRYRDAAYAANAYVRRTVDLAGPPDTRGGIKGSFPVHGHYGTFEYLNWASKFFIDSNLTELDLRATEAA